MINYTFKAMIFMPLVTISQQSVLWFVCVQHSGLGQGHWVRALLQYFVSIVFSTSTIQSWYPKLPYYFNHNYVVLFKLRMTKMVARWIKYIFDHKYFTRTWKAYILLNWSIL